MIQHPLEKGMIETITAQYGRTLIYLVTFLIFFGCLPFLLIGWQNVFL